MMSLSQIDYPPHWPDRHVLQIAASTCQFLDDQPGRIDMCLGREQVIEMLQALGASPLGDEFLGIAIRSELEMAADHLIDFGADKESLLDWALHLELLAAKLRQAFKD